MRTQADRDEDLAIGRELERKDAEIERLRATKDMAAFAWNGLCVYGDEKSIKTVQALLHATEAAREAIQYSIDMDGPDPGGTLLQAVNKCDRALAPHPTGKRDD